MEIALIILKIVLVGIIMPVGIVAILRELYLAASGKELVERAAPAGPEADKGAE
jgi:hypothetical protein